MESTHFDGYYFAFLACQRGSNAASVAIVLRRRPEGPRLLFHRTHFEYKCTLVFRAVPDRADTPPFTLWRPTAQKIWVSARPPFPPTSVAATQPLTIHSRLRYPYAPPFFALPQMATYAYMLMVGVNDRVKCLTSSSSLQKR